MYQKALLFCFVFLFVCFLRAAATWRGFRPSLLYQSSDITMVSWWAGTSLLRSLLVRQVAVGPGDRGSTNTGFCTVLGNPIRLFALLPRRKCKLPSPLPRGPGRLSEPSWQHNCPPLRSSTVPDSVT